MAQGRDFAQGKQLWEREGVTPSQLSFTLMVLFLRREPPQAQC